MNLTKIEKTIIAILVVGGILAAGIFMFVKPAYDKIDKANKSLESMHQQEEELNTKLARETTIDNEIKEAKKDAETLEGGFYPDLTTYEAVEIALAYLKDCDLTIDSIDATPLSTTQLSLEYFVEEPVIYDLKSFSQSARGTDEEVLLEGQFKDGNKVYTITVTDINNVQITDQDGNAIEASKYTDTMKDAYKEALCRYAADSKVFQTIGVTQVSFEVTGEYQNYLKFVDYLFDQERATYMEEMTIPMTVTVNGDSDSVFIDEAGNMISGDKASGETTCTDKTIVSVSCDIQFMSVEQMEELETIKAGQADIVVNQ